MIKITHTPGPWLYKADYISCSIKAGDGKSIAAIASSVKRPIEEKVANAELIVAAPRMAAVLRLIIEMAKFQPASNHWAHDAAKLAAEALPLATTEVEG